MPASSTEKRATQRIAALSAQLSSTLSSPEPSSTAPIAPATMSADRRPPITCHVLDTTVGKPGANIPVTLSLISAKGQHTGVGQPPLTATTNADGRVTAWETPRGCFGLEELFHLKDVEQTYALKFDTQEYFEQRDIKAFFPEVEVRFLVDNKKEHYHVPVLLGPFGYTTYRGS